MWNFISGIFHRLYSDILIVNDKREEGIGQSFKSEKDYILNKLICKDTWFFSIFNAFASLSETAASKFIWMQHIYPGVGGNRLVSVTGTQATGDQRLRTSQWLEFRIQWTRRRDAKATSKRERASLTAGLYWSTCVHVVILALMGCCFLRTLYLPFLRVAW